MRPKNAATVAAPQEDRKNSPVDCFDVRNPRRGFLALICPKQINSHAPAARIGNDIPAENENDI